MGGKITAPDLQAKHHCSLLQMRCQDRIVQSDNFASAWNLAKDEQRKDCILMLRSMEIDKLKTWMTTILFADLSTQRVIQLRKLASNYSIKGYCNMSKEQLLEALINRGIQHDEISQGN